MHNFEQPLVTLENATIEAREHLESALSLAIILCRSIENDDHINNQSSLIIDKINEAFKALDKVEK